MIQSHYNFVAPGKILFGWGRRHELTDHLPVLGEKVHLICGSRTLQNHGELGHLADALKKAGISLLDVEMQSGEPTVEEVDCLVQKYRTHGVCAGDGSLFIAMGGGSALDITKAICAMLPNAKEGQSVQDFLEGVGTGAKLEHPAIPMVAIPTTAGTGAEATRNAVLASHSASFKKSLRDDRLMPRLAVVDPELTVSNPPEITAASGMDAITQLLESFLSLYACPIPQSIAIQGLRLAFQAIVEAFQDGNNRVAREKMSHAALLSGICLANSGLGMVHGISAALGIHGNVPHGQACAILLPKAMRWNAKSAWNRFVVLANILFPDTFFANEEDAVETLLYEICMLCNTLKIPRRLSEVGIRKEQLPQITTDSRGHSMSGNPRTLSEEEILDFLLELW